MHQTLWHFENCACRTFIEDYNTGTLPNRKYYDLAAYERKKALKARESGSDEVWEWAFVLHLHWTTHQDIASSCRNWMLSPDVQDLEKAVFNDEAEVAAARKRQELIAQQERLREAYNELKYTAPDKVEAMRDQEMTRMKMSLAYRTGKSLLSTVWVMQLLRFTD